jgi:membrane protein DedA with SNARE-associated domain
MFWYFLSATIMGLIVYTLGTYTVMVNMFMVTFKFAATALVVAALSFLYRKYRARKRAARPRRLLP